MRTHLAQAVRVLLALGALSTLGVVATTVGPAAVAHAQDLDPSGEDAVLSRINELRAQAGAGPLVRDGQLDVAARQHSVEMADADQLMHVSPHTGTPIDRVHAAGHDTGEIAENVAMHTTSASAQQALEGSDAHLANMLNPRFTHVGLASVRDERGFYLTQVFARIEVAPAPEPAPADIEPVPPPPSPALQVPVAEAPVVAGPVVAAAPDPSTLAPAGPTVSGPTVSGPTVSGPTVSGPTVSGPTVSGPDTSGPIGAPGQVLTVRTAQGATVGYWVCGSARWWYYPLPASTTSGQQLVADLSVTGSPPGYGACAPGPTARAHAAGPTPGAAYGAPAYGAPAYGAPATAYGYGQPQYAVPAPRYAPAPAPTYHQPRVVLPGAVIGPWGGVGVRMGVGPQPYGRVILVR